MEPVDRAAPACTPSPDAGGRQSRREPLLQVLRPRASRSPASRPSADPELGQVTRHDGHPPRVVDPLVQLREDPRRCSRSQRSQRPLDRHSDHRDGLANIRPDSGSGSAHRSAPRQHRRQRSRPAVQHAQVAPRTALRLRRATQYTSRSWRSSSSSCRRASSATRPRSRRARRSFSSPRRARTGRSSGTRSPTRWSTARATSRHRSRIPTPIYNVATLGLEPARLGTRQLPVRTAPGRSRSRSTCAPTATTASTRR